MSRSGERSEILRGPLFYGIAFVVLTLVFWKSSPVGIVALMLLCGGDGFADVIGSRLGKGKLPWSKGKSWFGSLAMFLGGYIFSSLVLWVFIMAGIFPGSIFGYLLPILIISLACTLVESLPLLEYDNITIPITAVLFGLAFF
jgi:phytol kinase